MTLAPVPLPPFPRPGLFIAATGTDVGKTTVTSALATALHRLGAKVGLCKPVASGCPKFPAKGNDHNIPLVDDDLIPIDSLLPAQAIGLDVSDADLMRHLSPIRYAAPVAPPLAAQIENRPLDWRRIRDALQFWERHCDFLLVEAAGGWLTPIDEHDRTIADLATALQLPIVLVTNPELGSLNNTLLAVESIRARGLPIAGLVINRVPAPGQRDFSIDSNLTELPRLTRLPLLAVLPAVPSVPLTHPLPNVLVEPLISFAQSLLGRSP